MISDPPKHLRWEELDKWYEKAYEELAKLNGTYQTPETRHKQNKQWLLREYQRDNGKQRIQYYLEQWCMENWLWWEESVKQFLLEIWFDDRQE